MNSLTEAVTTIAVAIVGVALLAVFLSKNSNTAGVIQAGGSAFGSGLATALSPITGSSTAPNYTYPSTSSFSASSFA